MYFLELQHRLLEHVRNSIRNGELTERGLARLVGVSQPHIHNVLKGARILSPEMCDRVMVKLELTVIDLLRASELGPPDPGVARPFAWVRLLKGLIGPGQAWPELVCGVCRFTISSETVAAMSYPVAAQLGHDPAMEPLFVAGDCVVLDQAAEERRSPQRGAYYLVRIAGHPLVRTVELTANSVAIGALDGTVSARPRPSDTELLHLVRARAHLVSPAVDWHSPLARKQAAT